MALLELQPAPTEARFIAPRARQRGQDRQNRTILPRLNRVHFGRFSRIQDHSTMQVNPCTAIQQLELGITGLEELMDRWVLCDRSPDAFDLLSIVCSVGVAHKQNALDGTGQRRDVQE